jgi:hypothetical protein
VRNTGKVLEFVNDIKKIFNNKKFFISIYSGTDIGIRDIKFSEKYKMPVERAGREVIMGMKNSARPQSLSKRRKLIR